jgi:hypothetical protein
MSGLSSSYVSGVFFFVQFRLGITDDVLRKVERVQSIGLEQKRNYLNACCESQKPSACLQLWPPVFLPDTVSVFPA